MERRVMTTLRLPEELHEQLKRIADEEDRPFNSQVVRWLREAVDRYRAEHPERPQADRPE
jgi:hypothetical protein